MSLRGLSAALTCRSSGRPLATVAEILPARQSVSGQPTRLIDSGMFLAGRPRRLASLAVWMSRRGTFDLMRFPGGLAYLHGCCFCSARRGRRDDDDVICAEHVWLGTLYTYGFRGTTTAFSHSRRGFLFGESSPTSLPVYPIFLVFVPLLPLFPSLLPLSFAFFIVGRRLRFSLYC